MSGEILHGLFNGKIIPWERRNPSSKKQSALLQKIEREEQYFTSKLSQEDWERFQKLSQLQMELSHTEEENIFSYSFTLGMLLMLDVMQGAETLFLDELSPTRE